MPWPSDDRVPRRPRDGLRAATVADGEQLLRLWRLLLDEDQGPGRGHDDQGDDRPWERHARAWFARAVGDPRAVHVPVVESEGVVVSAAIGTLELGVPNPWCPRGRTVRLANLVTLPAHRGTGHASLLVQDVVAWARAIDADRVDLSATPEGRGIYERAGFVLTSAPRMKLVL